MHPFCFTLLRRPDLVVDHLSAYAALLQQEASQASQTLINRVLIWSIVVLSAAICVVLSGTALMLGVLHNQFHWVLIAVPGALGLCALGAFAWTRQPVLAGHFSNVKLQFLSDASALRTAAGHKVQ